MRKKKLKLTKSKSRKLLSTNPKHAEPDEEERSFDEESSVPSYVEKPSATKKGKAVIPSSKNVEDHSNTEETWGSDITGSERTSILQEKAQNVVKKLFLSADTPTNNKNGQKIAAMCFQDLRKSKPNSNEITESVAYDSDSRDSDSSDNSQSDNYDSSECSTVPDRAGKKYAVQTECIQSGKKRKHDKKRQQRQKKLKSWLQESCKSRPKTKATSSRIYARKHRAGLYLSKERRKSVTKVKT